jgi:hypothetical protein
MTQQRESLMGGPFKIFDAHDYKDEDISKIYSIQHGEALLVSAFNMPEEGEIFVEMVITSVPDWGRRAAPHMVEVISAKPTIGEPDNWVIDETHLQLLIQLPGSYRFILNDESMVVETDLLVMGQYLQQAKLPELGVLVLR